MWMRCAGSWIQHAPLERTRLIVTIDAECGIKSRVLSSGAHCWFESTVNRDTTPTPLQLAHNRTLKSRLWAHCRRSGSGNTILFIGRDFYYVEPKGSSIERSMLNIIEITINEKLSHTQFHHRNWYWNSSVRSCLFALKRAHKRDSDTKKERERV